MLIQSLLYLSLLRLIQSQILDIFTSNHTHTIYKLIAPFNSTILFEINQNNIISHSQCSLYPLCQCSSQELHIIDCALNDQISEMLMILQKSNITLTLLTDIQNPHSHSKYNKQQYAQYISEARIAQQNQVIDSDMDSVLKVSDVAVLKWKFNSDGTFDMIMQWNKDSWVGLGLGHNMDNTDMLIFNKIDGAIVIIDAWSTSDTTPETDSINNIQQIAQSVTDQGFNIRFQRKLNTGDSHDKILEQGQNYTFALAYSSASSLQKHTTVGTFHMPFKAGINETTSLDVEPNVLLYVHAILLFISWGFLADLGILIVRFFKTWKYFILAHTIIFVFVDFITITLIMVMLIEVPADSSQRINSFHRFMAIILLSAVVLQHICGIIIKTLVEKKDKNNNQFGITLKQFHMLLGTIMFLFAKIEINIGFSRNGNDLLFGLNLAWTIFMVIIRIGFTCQNLSQTKIKNKVKPTEPKLTDQQHEILKLLEFDTPTSDIIQQIPDIKWILLNNDVYDVTDFLHPGGMFLINNVIGKEISRYFYGAYPLENTTMNPHSHTQIAYNYLQTRYIGTIKLTEYKQGHSKCSIVDKKSLSKSIYQYTFEQKGAQIKIQQPITTFGQHYQLSLEEFGGKIRLYTKIISMSPPAVEYRNNAIKHYKGETQELPKLTKEQTDSITLIIKQYNVKDGISNTLPNYKDHVFIQGPFGRGLELGRNSKNLAIVGGTGLLPFIDFLDYLVFKSIHMVYKFKNHPSANSIFTKNDELGDDFEFSLIASFKSEDEFIGKEWIRELYKINVDNNLKLFNIKVRYSNGFKDPIIPSIQKLTQLQIDQEIGDGSKHVYICGPPQMNFIVLDQLNKSITQKKDKIHIV